LAVAEAEGSQHCPEDGLTRLITPEPIVRLVAPAVLMRLVTPVLTGVAVVPASPTSASSTAIAAVVALGAVAKAPISNGPELLAVVGVVAVDIVEDAKWVAALGGLGVVAATLHLGLGREHSRALALHVLGLVLLVFRVGLRELKEGETTFLCPRAPGCHVEHLQGRAQILVYGEFFLHLDIPDAISER
jgi:hypothetical protein